MTSIRRYSIIRFVACGNIRRRTSQCGSIAQLGEHLPYKQGVTGSSPVVPTNGPVVQLVRTLACHARGRGFEPHPGRHKYAGLAHLVERHLAKVEVASSSLVTRSKIKRTPSGVLFILEYGNAYPLRRESSSPDFMRKGNPQRFPFHTFPSLRGGGAARMGGASFLFWIWGTQGILRRGRPGCYCLFGGCRDILEVI